MTLKKNVILRRPQSGRLEGRTSVIPIETESRVRLVVAFEKLS